MAKFIVRRLMSLVVTVLLVSIAIFVILEATPGNVARNVLGAYITPEQEASFLAQMGLDKPSYVRYAYWLVGSDWHAAAKVDISLRETMTDKGFVEWWAEEEDGSLVRWKLSGGDLVAQYKMPDGTEKEDIENFRWQIPDPKGQAARLSAYRSEVLNNDRLSDEDRQALIKVLDQMIVILEQGDLTQDQLAEVLSGPESTLNALTNTLDSSHIQEALQKAADEVLSNNELLQALNTLTMASDPAQTQSMQLGDLKALSRRLITAAKAVEEANPALAENLNRIAADLDEGDTTRAQDESAEMTVAIREELKALNQLYEALDSQNIEDTVTTLREMADPEKTSRDADKLKMHAQALKAIRKSLKELDPELAAALRTAADSYKADDGTQARTALSQAADRLANFSQDTTLNEVVQKAQVVREFWGVDNQNHAVRWEKGTDKQTWTLIAGVGLQAGRGGATDYIPLQRGLLRGDPGVSLRTGRPVSNSIFLRLRNSLVLALIAFVIVMPLALLLGLIAGLNEGRAIDRVLSVGGLVFTAMPEFATGIFLILIFASWLGVVPGATVFGEQAPWERPDMLILPILTLTLIELGYVLRITRASIVEVMRAPYIRTARLKGLPYWHIVFKHALRNALMAPITVIMLHVNWLLGGIIIVEAIFGYPGLGQYLLDAALFKDTNAIEAGAMVLVLVAVGTQLIADIIYTFLNPRIRYA